MPYAGSICQRCAESSVTPVRCFCSHTDLDDQMQTQTCCRLAGSYCLGPVAADRYSILVLCGPGSLVSHLRLSILPLVMAWLLGIVVNRTRYCCTCVLSSTPRNHCRLTSLLFIRAANTQSRFRGPAMLGYILPRW